MKGLLLLALGLTLSACTLVTRATGEAGTITVSALTLLITNPGPDAITGDPGREGDGPALRVEGVNIMPTGAAATWCRAEGVRWACNLPKLEPGPALEVAFRAKVDGAEARIVQAALSGYRASRGATPTVITTR